MKYHVSEILSKLGADSREEAAEYWRRYNGMAPRFARVFRAILGGTAMKVAAGTAAIAIAGAGLVAVAVLFTPRDGKSVDAPTLEAVSVEEVGLLSNGTAVVVNLRADSREQWVARFREFTLILADGTEVEGTTFAYWAHDPDSIHRTVVPSGGASVSVGFQLPGEWVEPAAIVPPDGRTRIELPVASRLPTN